MIYSWNSIPHFICIACVQSLHSAKNHQTCACRKCKKYLLVCTVHGLLNSALAFTLSRTVELPHEKTAVTAKLINAFVFATRIVQFPYFLNPKFPACSHLFCLYRCLCRTCSETPASYGDSILKLRLGTHCGYYSANR